MVSYKQAENKLKDYYSGKHRNKILNRRLQLRYPYYFFPSDENIGGGKTNSTSDPTESVARKRADDAKLNKLQREEEAIKNFLKHLDLKTEQILYYFYKKNNTWGEVSEVVGYSITACKNKRSDSIKKLAEWLKLE